MESSSNAAREAARARLAAAEAKREDILLYHIANGVNIESRTVEIDEGVVIAPGATILSGTILRGKTIIGAGCVIGPSSLIEDSTVDEGTTVNASQVYGSHLGPHNNIGPFTHVRVNTVTDYGVHLGAYVETKNSNFARGNTVSHLTYIGDSDVGKYCNFGCGTVTCNYDGKDKFRTTIGDYCFIGCNTNLVAPVKVGDGAYTAAGSTITKDVPAQALGIARDRQTNLEGWAAPKMEAYIAKKKKLEDEQETYKDVGDDYGYNMEKVQFRQAKHNWQAAQYTYSDTVQTYELKFKQGTISQNALLDARDSLKEAEEKVQSAANDLFSSYNTYRWAVEHGVLN